MSITIKEIAKLAGVGRATVDRALKGKDGIKPSTREKVLKIAKQYHYKPNTIGKALVFAKNKHKIFVILNSLGNIFFDEVLRGINDASSEISDYGFVVEYKLLKGYNVAEQCEAIDFAYRNGAKSILITPINSNLISEKLNFITSSGIQVVTVNADIDCEKLAYVGCNYTKSGQTIGRIIGMIAEGRANILIVTGSLKMKGHRDRVAGAINVLNSYKGIRIVDVLENNDDEIESYDNVKNCLLKNPNIDFLLVTAGGVNGAIKALESTDRQIKLATFDDTEKIKELMFSDKIIATVTQQPYEQGYLAIKIIFNYIVNKKVPNENVYTEISIKIKENIN